MESASTQMQSEDRPSAARIVFERLKLIGLLGATQGLHEDAGIIGAAVEQMMPDPFDYRIMLVVAQAMGGDATQAVEATEARLAERPDDDMLKVVKGVSMLIAGQDDWRSTLDNVLALSLDQSARTAALEAIDRAPLLLRRVQRRAQFAGLRTA